MITPYECAGPLHVTGLQIPLDHYMRLIYGVKTWAYAADVTLAGEVGDRSATLRLQAAATLDKQICTGYAPLRAGDIEDWSGGGSTPALKSFWAARLMGAGNRRIVYDVRSADPDPVDEPLKLAGGDGRADWWGADVSKKAVAAWMNWFGDVTGTATWTNTDPFGTYEYSYPFAIPLDLFSLPASGYPLAWGDEYQEASSGIKITSFSDALIYLAAQFSYAWSYSAGVSDAFGSRAHRSPTCPTTTPIIATIDGCPVLGAAGFAFDSEAGAGWSMGLASGTVSLDPLEWWD